MAAIVKRCLLASGHPFRSIAAAVAAWVVIGVPVAAVMSAFRAFVWVMFSLPEMVATAAVLGSVQGLWLYLAGRPSEPQNRDLRWFAPVSGGILGLLGFPPVFSRINGIVVDRLSVAIFLLAAFAGGISAGFASAKTVVQFRGRRSSTSRYVVVGCFLVLPLAAVDYHVFWPSTVDRLPVPRVSHRAVTNIVAGDARGSTWTGCYQYQGHLSRGSGVVGGEGCLLRVQQEDGSLNVSDGSTGALLGSVDGDGRFRFGAERTAPDQDVLRVLWEGRFEGSSLRFTQRTTVLDGDKFLNTTRLTGTAERISCTP